MLFVNIEIKARTTRSAEIRQYLLDHHADYKGTDHQVDTYFHSKKGRLKLRQGNIETNLIYYERNNQAGPKQSDFSLVKVTDADALKAMLAAAMGVKVTVTKKREIFFIENVKFHLDILDELGGFVEIEASNRYAPLSNGHLNEQCDFYMREFGIKKEDLINVSYSDMLLALSGE